MDKIIIILALILFIIIAIMKNGGKGTSINLSLFNIQEPKRPRTKTFSESSMVKKNPREVRQFPRVKEVQKFLMEDNEVKKVKKRKSLKA